MARGAAASSFRWDQMQQVCVSAILRAAAAMYEPINRGLRRGQYSHRTCGRRNAPRSFRREEKKCMFYIMSSFICSTTKVTRETARLGRTEKQREVHVARSLPAGSVSQPMRRVGRHFQGRHFEKRSRAGAPGQRGARGSAERSGGGQGASRLCKKGRAAPADAAGAARGP